MARRTRKPKLANLPAQPDASAELDSALLLAAATPVLKQLKADLLARANGSAAVTRALSARHQAEKEARRTSDGFVASQGRFVEQVAAAWLLSCVFVGTLEHWGQVEQARPAGPGATDSQKLLFELGPSLSERDGDLYDDLDEGVRKRFAPLQTPRFVESYILDKTLDRAIDHFGLSDTTLIDSTLGSGHFLLSAFERLTRRRRDAQPGLEPAQAPHEALDQVYGADINPYGVAIVRFRLTLAYLDTAGYQRLRNAPKLSLGLIGLQAIGEDRVDRICDAAGPRPIINDLLADHDAPRARASELKAGSRQ